MKSNLAVIIDSENLPTPKEERWKYTNLPAALRQLGIVPAAAATANWTGPTTVEIAAGEIKTQAIEIHVTASEKGMATPMLMVRLGAGAEATLIEYHTGDNAFWNNATAQIELDPGARLRHYRLQAYGPQVIYTQMTDINLGRDALYESFTLTTGAALSRNEIYLALNGENGHCELNGVNLLRGEQHGDTTLIAHHRAPHCVSHQFYRTVLDDRARGVFQGKIHVDRIAQKTDGYQMSRALILAEGAEMDMKPELEIYADDVKCSHGATTGQLDEEALFYLRSRGIGRDEARSLLIAAFIDEAMEKITNESVRADFLQKAQAWLNP